MVSDTYSQFKQVINSHTNTNVQTNFFFMTKKISQDH